MENYMAIDQYGRTHPGLGQHPRKELLQRLGRKRAAKMYVDGKDGQSYHCGWIIGGLWLNVYAVTPMRERS